MTWCDYFAFTFKGPFTRYHMLYATLTFCNVLLQTVPCKWCLRKISNILFLSYFLLSLESMLDLLKMNEVFLKTVFGTANEKNCHLSKPTIFFGPLKAMI